MSKLVAKRFIKSKTMKKQSGSKTEKQVWLRPRTFARRAQCLLRFTVVNVPSFVKSMITNTGSCSALTFQGCQNDLELI